MDDLRMALKGSQKETTPSWELPVLGNTHKLETRDPQKIPLSSKVQWNAERTKLASVEWPMLDWCQCGCVVIESVYFVSYT